MGAVADLLISQGMKVVLVSCRMNTKTNYTAIRDVIKRPVVPIYLTSRAPKEWYLHGKGIYPDWWLDDDPRSISQGK